MKLKDSTLFLVVGHYDLFRIYFNHVKEAFKKHTNDIYVTQFLKECLDYCLKYQLEFMIITHHFLHVAKLVDLRNKLIPDLKIIVSHQKRYFPASYVPQLHAILEWAPTFSAQCYQVFNSDYPEKYIRISYPIFLPQKYRDDLLKEASQEVIKEPYLFTGGQNARTYSELIKATQQMGIKLVIVTNRPKNMKIPNHVHYRSDIPKREFHKLMINSLAVVIPVVPSAKSVIGQTVLSEANMFGKAIIVLNNPSLVENITGDGVIAQNNVTSYRTAIEKVLNPDYRMKMEEKSRIKGNNVVFEEYLKILEHIAIGN